MLGNADPEHELISPTIVGTGRAALAGDSTRTPRRNGSSGRSRRDEGVRGKALVAHGRGTRVLSRQLSRQIGVATGVRATVPPGGPLRALTAVVGHGERPRPASSTSANGARPNRVSRSSCRAF
jgi:hypothetical protein